MKRTSATFALRHTNAPVALVCSVAWVLLFAIGARAEPPARPAENSSRRDSLVTFPPVVQGSSPVVVHHVVLGPPNGVLTGRVLAPSGKSAKGGRLTKGVTAELSAYPGANLRVVLVRDGRALAITRTDRSGRFALRNLSQGLYQIVVDGPGSLSRRTCRVWFPSSAPPSARGSVKMMLGEGIVRGQGPFPILSFPQAAAVGGVVAGAIAAPIIYHNVRSANRDPASP